MFMTQRIMKKIFFVGDWVYLRLQPYRKMLVFIKSNFKLSVRYCGPFQVLKCIGIVFYKLEWPREAQIHLEFYVSLLKKKN
jgi:hypothetical protein